MVRSFVSSLAFLALVVVPSTPLGGQSSALVPTGSTWRYLDDGSNQGTAWRAPAFNDALWATGPAQLGYGDGDEATVVRYGANAGAKQITTYFRRTFAVANPADFSSLSLRILRDDGAVVYLNGSEVFRTNMPTGTISDTTPASAAIVGADESVFVSAALSPSSLVAGSNVIAVEVHQSDPTSSDLSFDLELLGESSVTLTRGPYLQLGTPTSTVVRWRTSAPVVGRVQFGPSPGVVSGSGQEAAARTEHEVRLAGLVPDTLYYYSIGTPTTTIAGDATFQFKTSPLPGTERPLRVWVIGDSGTADANAGAVRDSYTAFTGSRHTDLWLMLGDNAYNDGLDPEYQAAVFNTYPAMLRKTMLWPAYGNHDGYGSDSATNTGPYYDIFTLPKQGEAGGVASGTEAYYSFDYANIHFVCLESFETDRSPTAPMLSWLQRDLAANTQRWVIVFFHHPPYSKGSHDSDAEIELVQMRQNALPILENFGVDLVLAGHSHAYERSFLLDGHYGDSTTFSGAMKKDGGSGRADASGAYQKPTYWMAPHEGTVYMVAGTAGKMAGGTLNHPAMYSSQAVLGSVVLDVLGNRLDATFLDSTGVRRDYFSIVKGADGPTPPSAWPFGGTPPAIPGVVEAEHFDEGGAGAAYHDTTLGNRGGSFRNTDVDIETTADAGGGYNVGWIRPGEWLQYTVNVTVDAQYDLMLRLASTGSGGVLHLDVDGVNATGAIQVPNTGGWQAWSTVTVGQVPLRAGTRRLRLAFDANGSTGGVANVNRLELTRSTGTGPYGGTAVALPGTIEAENFDEGGASVAYFDTTAGNRGGAYRQTDVDIEGTTDAGGGWNIGWVRAGEWLQYTADVSATGTYALELRVASASTGGTLRVEVDGVDVTGTLSMPNTGGWQAWRTIRKDGIVLQAGLRRIRLVFVGAGTDGIANLNFLRFVQ
jgi:carbohydrate binding protein with CBM6 domain/calcineurin-like phosphoesterase family protein/purple acid phosphatase-like protein